ncbi:aminotransferase class IV [Reichenbachiella carrageenanivorans]|uniref:Aminotransferase class IV n=1 Tax=Reichenbachiella carrageenanivorans TaxID=2979869 RepID=A0ABY6D058_9BACT|nr:aminotransferase class IV [Reichenbachiella carrageenanivorans]UXX79020.1 aminotransferase class IV [Reichenbachiella carrageenanivorans]
MSQFIESICCEDGEALLLDLHQARLNRTFFTNYGLLARPMKLAKIIRKVPSKEKHKCKVVYDKDNFTIDFQSYQTPTIETLQIVEGGNIDYRFKYENRRALDQLYTLRADQDNIIIVKDGSVTDSYFANLAFYDGEEWWTPDSPLLEGVRRQSLLDQGLIQKTTISLDDLGKFEKVSLINAMLDLGVVEIDIKNINR